MIRRYGKWLKAEKQLQIRDLDLFIVNLGRHAAALMVLADYDGKDIEVQADECF